MHKNFIQQMMMIINTKFYFILGLLLILYPKIYAQAVDKKIISYVVNPKTDSIALYWKDDNGILLKSIQNLKQYVEGKGKTLNFAMNGGMYKMDNSPQGLFIQNKTTHALLDTAQGNGNFYMKPNGVFYITSDNTPVICTTDKFIPAHDIKFATQSGPILLIGGVMHPAFKQGSKNLNIRNGVGVLPNNKIIFAISIEEVNFYDFAMFFKKMNCENALYLDGFVSRAYIPSQNWKQLDGNFGVMIGVAK